MLNLNSADNFNSVLQKANWDEWYYALETKTGQQFVFGSITVIDDEWIHLNPVQGMEPETLPFDAPVSKPFCVTDRGIDIRLDAIAWTADGIS